MLDTGWVAEASLCIERSADQEEKKTKLLQGATSVISGMVLEVKLVSEVLLFIALMISTHFSRNPLVQALAHFLSDWFSNNI